VTARMRAPAKPSHGRLNILVGVAIVLVALAALGCGAKSSVPTPTSAASNAAATPTPVGTTLLAIAGTGNKTTDPFHASGDSVDVTYSYNCAAPGSFTINFYGTNGSPQLPDVLTDEFGTKGSDTKTENLNGAAGPFHLEVNTACAWTVKVVGRP